MYIYSYIYCLLQDVVIIKLNILCYVRSFERYILKTMAVIISNFRATFFRRFGWIRNTVGRFLQTPVPGLFQISSMVPDESWICVRG